MKCSGPKEEEVLVQLYPGSDGELIAVFSPERVGEHLVAVMVADQHVSGSPFRYCKAGVLSATAAVYVEGVRVGSGAELSVHGRDNPSNKIQKY